VPVTRRQLVFFVLGGFFLTNALLGELTGGKLFSVPELNLSFLKLPSVVLSIGVIPWPVVFITTDLINEYFGRAGVRRLTFLALAMISYSFIILYFEMLVPAAEQSPVGQAEFATVFGQSMWIIFGSLVAFLLAQLLDVLIFQALKRRTGTRLLWLRATGSTVVSQLIDTLVVLFIAFRVPVLLKMEGHSMKGEVFLRLAAGNYGYKVAIAILITPVIYWAHAVIDAYLAKDSKNAAEVTMPEPRT
jgi:queuosine precursor transporter